MAGNATTSTSQTVTIDNTAPTVAITFPTSSYSRRLAGRLRHRRAPPTSAGPRPTRPPGLPSVQVSLRQAAAPSLYWNPATSSFSSATEVLMPATLALPSWSLAAASAWFTNLSSYTIRAVRHGRRLEHATTSTTFTFQP